MSEQLAKNGQSPVPRTAPPSWGMLDPLRREIDRIFDDFSFSPWPRSFSALTPEPSLAWMGAAANGLMPAVDIVQKDSEFEMTVELPGLDFKDVEVKLSNNSLVIKGAKTSANEETKDDRYLSERRYGAFSRSFTLPDYIDRSKIDASFARGVLTIRLPKTKEAAKTETKINIKAA